MFPSLADFLIGGECWPHAGPQAVQWMWVLLQELVQGEEGGAGPGPTRARLPVPVPGEGRAAAVQGLPAWSPPV